MQIQGNESKAQRNEIQIQRNEIQIPSSAVILCFSMTYRRIQTDGSQLPRSAEGAPTAHLDRLSRTREQRGFRTIPRDGRVRRVCRDEGGGYPPQRLAVGVEPKPLLGAIPLFLAPRF
jgi:hypothetical protein